MQKYIGETVLITGASSGIGLTFAKAYAKQGYRLILVARREERLKQIAEKLDVKSRIIVADLEQESECKRLCKLLEEEQIHIFINNAGFGDCGSFFDTDLEKELSMIRVNIEAAHILFKYMLGKMKKQGYGSILNVASSAGLLPGGPYMATYYATKAYVTSLTRSVAEELREEESPLYVCALCPGPVDTEFNDRANVVFALKGISPKACVHAALRGMKQKRVIIVPSFMVRMGSYLQTFVPNRILLPMIAKRQKSKYNKG